MPEDGPSWPSDVRELQELFVDVTGEQASTDRQAPDKGRGVVNTTDADTSLRPEDVEAGEGSIVESLPGHRDDVIDGQPEDFTQ